MSSVHLFLSVVQHADVCPLADGLRSAHHFTLDCDSSQKGLCAGILVLVLTIISLVLFLVLHNEENYVQLAVYEVSICEMCIYILCTLAVLACMVRIRVLPAGMSVKYVNLVVDTRDLQISSKKAKC